MKRAAVIARLLALRRAKEQSALEALMRRDGDCRRAEQQVEAARDASARQMAQFRARERMLVQRLVGRSVSLMEMMRLQAELDVMAAESARLREDEQTAKTVLRDNEKARDLAREHFGRCQRAATKLGHAADQERRKALWRQAARVEVELEGSAHINTALQA